MCLSWVLGCRVQPSVLGVYLSWVPETRVSVYPEYQGHGCPSVLGVRVLGACAGCQGAAISHSCLSVLAIKHGCPSALSTRAMGVCPGCPSDMWVQVLGVPSALGTRVPGVCLSWVHHRERPVLALGRLQHWQPCHPVASGTKRPQWPQVLATASS